MNGVQTRLKCKPNVKRCKRFVFPSHSPLLHHNALTTKTISHFQADHILTRFVFPPLLVVFDEEIILWQGNKYYYNAELFRHTPGRYRFFLTVRRYSKEYTLMTEFQLQDNMIELFKRHPYSQLNDTLLPSEEEAVYPPIYNVIDQMPEFPGGIDKLLQFINDNMKYPTKAQTEGIQGRVAVQFIVDENGYIIEPNIVRSVEPSLDNEALRLIKMLPQWKPGTLKGKAVKVKYTVPVAFKLK